MNDTAVVLASASPRRRRLIGLLGLEVATFAAEIDEDLSADADPAALAARLAANKAIEVRRAESPAGLIVAFDTIVIHDGRVLGKPADEDDARRMLASLSGRVHDVITGVALLEPGAAEPATFTVTTRVTMRALTARDIDGWIAAGECMGCAGAYNIERHLARVEADECFQNVAGLPLCHLYAALAAGRFRGVPGGLHPPVTACDGLLDRSCRLGPSVCAGT